MTLLNLFSIDMPCPGTEVRQQLPGSRDCRIRSLGSEPRTAQLTWMTSPLLNQSSYNLCTRCTAGSTSLRAQTDSRSPPSRCAGVSLSSCGFSAHGQPEALDNVFGPERPLWFSPWGEGSSSGAHTFAGPQNKRARTSSASRRPQLVACAGQVQREMFEKTRLGRAKKSSKKCARCHPLPHFVVAWGRAKGGGAP